MAEKPGLIRRFLSRAAGEGAEYARSLTLVGGGSSEAQEVYISDPLEAYKRVGLVRRCINTTAYFATRRGFVVAVPSNHTAKKEIDEVNKRVEMNQALYISIIKREVFGRAAWQILRADGKITRLVPLKSQGIRPVIDQTTLKLMGYTYNGKTLAVNQVLYFPNDPLETDLMGMSSVAPIMSTINLKMNLERDLLEAAKRTWGPIGVFQMDTGDILDPVKKQERMTEFANSIKPGESIVMNRKIDGKIYDLKPDINALVRALEKADEEIMGNWGMPKAILSREKTVTKATLEFSLKALYEGSIEGQQAYFKQALERQWYPRVLESLHYDPTTPVHHVWAPVAIQDPELISAIIKMIDAKLLTIEQAYVILGWQNPETPGGSDKPIVAPKAVQEGDKDAH